MIRRGTPTDFPAMIEMGRAFFVEAGHEGSHPGFTFDPESFAATLGQLEPHGMLLVVEKDGRLVGMAAMDMAHAFWNHKVILGREAFFYIVPAARKGLGRKLIAAMETAAASYGATVFDVVAEPGPRSKPLAEIYRRASYNPAETTFRKRLSTPGIV